MKRRKKIWSTAGFELSSSGFRTAVTRNTCIIQDTNCAHLNTARHRQFQEKEKTPTTELNIFLSRKVFRRKITKGKNQSNEQKMP